VVRVVRVVLSWGVVKVGIQSTAEGFYTREGFGYPHYPHYPHSGVKVQVKRSAGSRGGPPQLPARLPADSRSGLPALSASGRRDEGISLLTPRPRVLLHRPNLLLGVGVIVAHQL